MLLRKLAFQSGGTIFFFSSRRRHTRCLSDWSSDVCSSDLDAGVIDKLAAGPVDVVSVHLPAMTAQTYQKIMGVDRFTEVIENIRRFVTRRQELRRSVPLIEIGRASCRERGEISGVYGSLEQ